MKYRGRYGSENDGMSSEKQERNLLAESLRIPGEGSSAQGKAGPKGKPRGVPDGQPADNPAPLETVRLKE